MGNEWPAPAATGTYPTGGAVPSSDSDPQTRPTPRVQPEQIDRQPAAPRPASQAEPARQPAPRHDGPRVIPAEGPMVRAPRPRPKEGWRALAFDATRGRWNPGLSDKEQRRRDRAAQIATQLRGKHVTAFFCLKGGVSKTSTTAATSIALSNLRPDPVFAIDANPDAGDLAERIIGSQLSGITALSKAVDSIESLEDLSRFTVTAGRLTMLPGEPNPRLGDSLSAGDFERIMSVVRRYYSYVQVDCGTGVTHPLMSGILRYTTTAVIPAAWSVTGARRAAETIDWLEDNGFEHLARTSIVVLTAKDIVSKSVDKDAVLEHLGKAQDLVVVPADPHMADGGVIDWDMLKPRTQEAFLDVAEAITARFDRGAGGGAAAAGGAARSGGTVGGPTGRVSAPAAPVG